LLQRLAQNAEQILTRLAGYNPYEVLVEYALIWVVMYLVWRFLRGTRGARVLKGVGLILIVSIILVAGLGSDNPGFERLRFLLEKSLGFAALALVIVFQPELRRAMVRLGEARLFRGTTANIDDVIEQVVAAVEDMSKNKIGAIIAIEREVGLEGIVETGTPINSDVTAELLKTIFWPGTALHDMGVIIRDGRLAAAGVQFPLAEGDEMSQGLGSRHRAAMGLSQEADCLIVVVSEETGAISLAERGQLLRKLSPDGLREMLQKGLRRQRPRHAHAAPRHEERPAAQPEDTHADNKNAA
jgi:diadenylate cyclase